MTSLPNTHSLASVMANRPRLPGTSHSLYLSQFSLMALAGYLGSGSGEEVTQTGSGGEVTQSGGGGGAKGGGGGR